LDIFLEYEDFSEAEIEMEGFTEKMRWGEVLERRIWDEGW
jgi:hypothetical protein